MATKDTEHQQIRELLPWYLNGTLGADEAARVQRHLERYPELEAEADETGALLQAAAADVPVPMLNHERLNRVMERIDDEPQASAGVADLAAALQRWWDRRPTQQLRWLPAAVAAALGLVALLLVVPRFDLGEPEYETFSSERPAVALQFTVAENLGQDEIQSLLDDYELNAERTGDGVYEIALPDDTPVTELYRVLQTLRADQRIVDARALTGEE